MNIIYLVSFYRVGDGTSAGVYSQIETDKSTYDDYLIVTKEIKSAQDGLKIVTNKQRQIIADFISKGPIVIHFFRGHFSNLLLEMLQLAGYHTPVVITVCQSPSYNNLWLTPFELKHAWQIVFIDKAAYNNSLVGFIPENVKTQIYLSEKGIYRNFETIPKSDNKGKIVYGRGSTSIKCPKTMFDVFDKIDVPNKLFRVVGIEGDSWVKDEAAKRDNVEVLGQLPIDKWEEVCNSFDVFLYQLPNDCFSSLDGTLGLAMLLGKPVVYMGCEAPKERFRHGENGFVANSIDEMAHYATLLGRDKTLREKIGEAGRLSTIKDFQPEERVRKYKDVYNRLDHHEKYEIPLSYVLKFLAKNKKQVKIYLRGWLREMFPTLFSLYQKLKV